MVNLFGAGFVGGEYQRQYECLVNPRDDYQAQTNDILYFISTIHNYHVFTDTHIDIDTNLTCLIRTLDLARDKFDSDFTFNFVSSWFVYGNTDMPANESSICYPRGFYSITKRTAEQLLISYCETFGIRYRILRLANVLGRNDSKVSAQKNALQYLINCMRDNEPIELYDDGDFYRDYIDVEDAVRAINLVITKGEINSIYNISNGHSLKFRDIIDYVHQRLNSRSEIQSIPQREFHKLVQVKTMYLDNSRLQSLGYRPRYTINQTLDRLL